MEKVVSKIAVLAAIGPFGKLREELENISE